MGRWRQGVVSQFQGQAIFVEDLPLMVEVGVALVTHQRAVVAIKVRRKRTGWDGQRLQEREMHDVMDTRRRRSHSSIVRVAAQHLHVFSGRRAMADVAQQFRRRLRVAIR